jgi:hypothetical protein
MSSRRRYPAAISSELSVNVADNTLSARVTAADYFALDDDRVRRFQKM